MDERISYADEDRSARAVVEERYKEEREDAQSEMHQNEVARIFPIVHFFGCRETDEEEYDAGDGKEQEKIAEEIGVYPSVAADHLDAVDGESACEEEESDV